MREFIIQKKKISFLGNGGFYVKKRYQNLDDVKNIKSIKDILRRTNERFINKKDLTTKVEVCSNVEIQKIKENHSEYSITWIGHSTFLIQMGGLNILTDPVWAKWMGTQKRITSPGIPIQELPDIQVVLISHAHYDHLDFNSIKRIKGYPTYYVPSGLKSLFVKRGYHNVIELNWWDTKQYEGIEISATPAQHWTRRSLFDTNTSHWCGYYIKNKKTNQSVYFVGDTGYFRGFKEIGSKYDIDTVLMPIGAYEPEWFMKASHINPEDSIKAFCELQGKLFIPMHYGAYRLADDTGPEALQRLYTEWDKLNLNKNKLKVIKIGESIWFK